MLEHTCCTLLLARKTLLNQQHLLALPLQLQSPCSSQAASLGKGATLAATRYAGSGLESEKFRHLLAVSAGDDEASPITRSCSIMQQGAHQLAHTGSSTHMHALQRFERLFRPMFMQDDSGDSYW
jgi:hypothetical protein